MPAASRIALAALIVAPAAVYGQAAARPAFAEFEVASIKPAQPNETGRWLRMQGAHQFAVHNHALLTMIAAAYNVSPRAISGGPGWVESDRYEILAKTPTDVRPNLAEQMAMLQKLLADRFHLSFHREPRELSFYAITVAKDGPKLKPTTVTADTFPEGPPPLIFVVSPQVIKLPARYASIADFAAVLQRAAIDRPVVDRTGLSGRYDFDLEFTPDETLFQGELGNGTPDSDKPGLSAAMQQQLGLKLEPTRGPLDAIVIDHVERPSEN